VLTFVLVEWNPNSDYIQIHHVNDISTRKKFKNSELRNLFAQTMDQIKQDYNAMMKLNEHFAIHDNMDLPIRHVFQFCRTPTDDLVFEDISPKAKLGTALGMKTASNYLNQTSGTDGLAQRIQLERRVENEDARFLAFRHDPMIASFKTFVNTIQ
jgi:hypothetical protein